MKLIAGLGNPGRKYERTRHNLGFVTVDCIAARLEIAVRKKVGGALIGEGDHEGNEIVLAKPQAFMNRSGSVIKTLLQEFHLTPGDLVVVYDDLDLPFGRIRIRAKGSAGGHRGLESIIECLCGAPFPRVRIGIGRPPEGVDAADYVLEPFDADQKSRLEEVITRASDAVMVLLNESTEAAMRQFNRQD